MKKLNFTLYGLIGLAVLLLAINPAAAAEKPNILVII